MNDDTAKKLLAILETHGSEPLGLSTAPEHRVTLYLQARAMLTHLVRRVAKDWIRKPIDPANDWENLAASAWAMEGAAELAGLLADIEAAAALHEVRLSC